MTRSELIVRLLERLSGENDKNASVVRAEMQDQSFDSKDADICVRAILNCMSSSLVAGKRIEIRGFGSFAVNLRPARVGRNPKTGDAVSVPEKKVPHFKCGKELRLRING